jgi:hypothetical protein
MKIISIHRVIIADDLLALIELKLDRLFRQQRQTAIHFTAAIKDDAVEIYQRELYDGFLFRIEIKGQELHITRSEHYVDDVNSLTVESILNKLFGELAEDGEVSLVLEG